MQICWISLLIFPYIVVGGVRSEEIAGQIKMPVIRGMAMDDVIPSGSNRKPHNNNIFDTNLNKDQIDEYKIQDRAMMSNSPSSRDTDDEEEKALERLILANVEEGKANIEEVGLFKKIVGNRCPQLSSPATKLKAPLKLVLFSLLLLMPQQGVNGRHIVDPALAPPMLLINHQIPPTAFGPAAEKCPTLAELNKLQNDYHKHLLQLPASTHIESSAQNSATTSRKRKLRPEAAHFEENIGSKNKKQKKLPLPIPMPLQQDSAAKSKLLTTLKNSSTTNEQQLPPPPPLPMTLQARLEGIFDIVLDITGASADASSSSPAEMFLTSNMMDREFDNIEQNQNWTRKEMIQKLAEKWTEKIGGANTAQKLSDDELGKIVVEKLCGQECFQSDQLPAYGVQTYGKKPPPKGKDVQRVLRPYLLRMARKFGTGRLWVDNPLPEHKNGFQIGYEFEKNADISIWDEGIIQLYLGFFQRMGPFIFVDVSKSTQMFKHVLHIQLTNTGEPFAPNGLDRSKREQHIQFRKGMDEINFFHLVAKALCAECGHNIDYGDGVYKYQSETVRMLTRLNAAYGAEDYYITGSSNPLYRTDPFSLELGPAGLLWTDYPDCRSGKFEVPVYIEDKTLKFILTLKSKFPSAKILHWFYKRYSDKDLDLQEVFDEFERKSVLRFKLVEEPPSKQFYVRIVQHANKATGSCFVGHTSDVYAEYTGEPFYLGIRRVNNYVLFHELLHIGGLMHEQQRMDAAEHVKYNMQVFEEERAGRKSKRDKDAYEYRLAFNYGKTPTNRIPFRPYNMESIMQYRGKQFNNSELFDDGLTIKYPRMPHQWDWDNLNALYGLAPGETKFDMEQAGQCKGKKK